MAPSRRRGKASAAAARRQWKVGDLVLAKVKGFPAWPATVSEPEKWGYSTDWKKVLVYFFGTKQIFCYVSYRPIFSMAFQSKSVEPQGFFWNVLQWMLSTSLVMLLLSLMLSVFLLLHYLLSTLHRPLDWLL
ncbi:protein HUA2-LIKE 3-like [Macadamia integrifolia]|uniref:protein HUA2-LIKE 3-like n=1 Tax=Macadamia integrifolia TaxID=60698 RepID=UPI001C52CB66|nr:protein HUA2-LIKE 3-like [Macadamia integrifolia]